MSISAIINRYVNPAFQVQLFAPVRMNDAGVIESRSEGQISDQSHCAEPGVGLTRFDIHTETMDAIKTHAGNIKNMAVERTFNELTGSLEHDPAKTIKMMHDTGMLQHVITELTSLAAHSFHVILSSWDSRESSRALRHMPPRRGACGRAVFSKSTPFGIGQPETIGEVRTQDAILSIKYSH